MNLHQFPSIILLSVFIGTFFAGSVGLRSPARWSQGITIIGVGLSCLLSWILFLSGFGLTQAEHLYCFSWLSYSGLDMHWGYLIDPLTLIMMLVVTTISLLVHLYSIGYMKDDPSQPRFFCYLSLFTFMMLTLVMSDNLLMMFFGWEGVGLVSYLLIGFWMERPSAAQASMKAFLVNRVGDCFLIIALALCYKVAHSFDYADLFIIFNDSFMVQHSALTFNATAWIAGMILIAAITKSAQVPLHFWLPDSMEGPTPISALIHAATMVTAGIFLVARLAPLFILEPQSADWLIFLGSVTIVSMGSIALVQDDIKRVIAYSTVSQLGYMVVALGLSAYEIAIFHLVTHAVFKSLLFLAAGGVIIAFQHEQDMNKMGGLARTHFGLTFFMAIGLLGLAGFPGSAGFFSKDLILAKAAQAQTDHGSLAYVATMVGVMLTALYSARLFYKVFLVVEAVPTNKHHIPYSIYGVLALLTLLSLIVGPVTYKAFAQGWFQQTLGWFQEGFIHSAIADNNLLQMILHACFELPFFITLMSIIFIHQSYCGLLKGLPRFFTKKGHVLYKALKLDLYFNIVVTNFLAPALYSLGRIFHYFIETLFIDYLVVDGSAQLIYFWGRYTQRLQTGYLRDYFLAGFIGFLCMFFLVQFH